MFDLIGDVHGHAEELVRLLDTLGYKRVHGIYRHDDRRVIFLGDFIDRGPQIAQVLEIVRPMIDQGGAMAVMGNHELNALAYHTEDPRRPGEYLRPRTEKNKKQHRQTIDQLTRAELDDYLLWFRTLPLWLDLDGIRVIHACWDDDAIGAVAQSVGSETKMTNRLLEEICLEGAPLFEPVEVILKGKETSLPSGFHFDDKDGHQRSEMRCRWYSWIRNEAGEYRALGRDEKESMQVPEGFHLYKPDNITSQGNPLVDFDFEGGQYTFRSKTPPPGLARLARAGRIHKAKNSVQYVRNLDDFAVIQVSQLWNDTGTGGFTDDKLYVVQTGVKTIQRCILMATDPGDLVLDPTCGSGTTATVAEQWGRRWITIDTSRVALALARARIMGARYPFGTGHPVGLLVWRRVHVSQS